jgi:hypothetical protein
LAFVSYWNRDFGSSPDAPKAEFVEQRTLVDLLQESRAQRIGHFEDSSEHSLGQGIEVSALIGVHRRPIIIKCRSRPTLSQLLLAADQHR